MKKPQKSMRQGTAAVWAGEQQPGWQGATQIPIVHSVAFGYDDLDQWLDVALGQKPGHIYGRNTNPTVDAFEDKARQLESAEAATSASTGMAIISSVLFGLLSPGDRIVSIKDTYGGTNRIFSEFLPRFQIEVVLCETTDESELTSKITDGCKMLYLETPTNPTIKIIDLEKFSRIGRDAGAIVVVDNTFATPINQNPLSLGADLVLHSATKFLGGHADALGGVVCGRRDLIETIFQFREINGASLHPMAAYFLLRGMKTLHLRIQQQNKTALKIARHLDQHPSVGQVFYPGLENHPGHEIARKQMRGFGGMLSFTLKEHGLDTVRDFLPKLQLAHAAANLGSVETIVGPPATTSHVECTAQERANMGIPESLIRYSTGIEDPDDLIADLDQALKKN